MRAICLMALGLLACGLARAEQTHGGEHFPIKRVEDAHKSLIKKTISGEFIVMEHTEFDNDKAMLQLALFNDMPGYLRLQKKWSSKINRNYKNSSRENDRPDLDPGCTRGLLFMSYIALMDIKNAEKLLLSNKDVRICNELFNVDGNLISERIVFATYFGDWLQASRSNELSDIIKAASDASIRSELAESAYVSLKQLSINNYPQIRRVAYTFAGMRQRQEDAGIPSWGQILAGGAIQIGNAYANRKNQEAAAAQARNGGSAYSPPRIGGTQHSTGTPIGVGGSASGGFSVSQQERNDGCLSVSIGNKVTSVHGDKQDVVTLTNRCGVQVFVHYCWNPAGANRQNTYATCGSPSMNLQRGQWIQAGATSGGNPYDWDFPVGNPSTFHYIFCKDGVSNDVRWSGSGLSGTCTGRNSSWSK